MLGIGKDELCLPSIGEGSHRERAPGCPLHIWFYPAYPAGTRIQTRLDADYIAGNTHPDHDAICTFRKRFLDQLKPLFLQILTIAHAMGVPKIGKISLDGTKIKANASKHRALSWGHADKLEEQLAGEINELLQMAEQEDAIAVPDGMDVPEEIARRQDRLVAIAKAKEDKHGCPQNS